MFDGVAIRMRVPMAMVAGWCMCALVGAGPVSSPAGPASATADAGGAETAVRVDAGVRAKLDAIVAHASGERDGAAQSVSIAVVEDGRIVYARASGLRDAGAKRAADEHTRFRIGSITKMFTAVAVMQLVERGAMHLDDRLAVYVPDAPHAREVTLRELLMHTSGIPNYLDDAFADGRVKNPTTPARIAASMDDRALNFSPGTKYDYSNTGYVLLGIAVEHVAKVTLADYERAHIFAPAGMRETTFAELPASDAGTATGYMDAQATPVAPYDASWMYADGDIVSTPSDVARFDIALMDGTLLASGGFAEMRAAPIATGEDGVSYGLGQSLFPLGDLTFVGHHGGLPGFEADNEMLPQQRFAVVVCGNAFNFSTPSVNGPLLATLFPRTAARAVAERAAALLVPGPGEDAAITGRFRTFFLALQKGRVDRATVTAQMNAALGAEQLSDVAGQLSALGTLQKLIFRSKDEHAAGMAFHYTGVFDKRTTPLTFTLDASGKIAGVFLQ